MPCEGFIDRVINDLKDHMVQASAVIRVTNVHSGALSHCIQALEDLDIGGIVIILAHALFPAL